MHGRLTSPRFIQSFLGDAGIFNIESGETCGGEDGAKTGSGQPGAVAIAVRTGFDQRDPATVREGNTTWIAPPLLSESPAFATL